ncbi:ATP-binding protein [Streptomyces sp. NPDC006990]|uniref:sensor histidine kinase n=1 Tax=unclassified Streptomyces TaxID=2593676 RepID=UPI003451E9EF
MVRREVSSGSRRPASRTVWWVPTVLVVLATVLAAALVPPASRVAVLVCGAVAAAVLAGVTAELVRRGAESERFRAEAAAREADLRRHLAEQEAATVRLAEEVLPRAVARLEEGEFSQDVLRSYPVDGGLGPRFRTAHEALLRSVVEAVQSEETMRDSAQRGVVNVARRVQAIVHQQATDLRTMEDRHGNEPKFFTDLLRLDHGTALIGRLADSIAVLGGARPGRQWNRAVPLYSVLRGAMSRILEYQRVELHSVAEVAVVGPAVEPLIHALAELLDNATRYSPPKTRVHLTAVEVHMGIAVEIEDGGVGLSEEARARAERMLKEARAGIDLNDLGESPRLGLAVVGRLAQAYDFQVSLPPSAYGGVRAVLTVPQSLITTAPAEGRAHGIGAASGLRPLSTDGPRPEPAEHRAAADTVPRREAAPAPSGAGTAPAAHPDAGAAADGEQDEAPERTPSGLPQRRRRRPRADGGPAASPRPARPGPAATAHEEPAPGVWMAELHSGLHGDRPAPDPARGNSDTSDKDE